MTFLLAIPAAAVALGVGVYVGRHFERKAWADIMASREDLGSGKIRNLIEYRVAIHEAGHAICAWFNPYTTSIDRITIDDGAVGEGKVYYTTSRNHEKAFWYRVVVNLGGIAGEMIEFKRMRSGTAKSDLVKAAHLARQIVGAGEIRPPWPWDPTTELPEDHFDVSAMYKSITPGTDEALVLNLAYIRARELIEKDSTRFLLLAGELATSGTIEAAGVKRIFGSRAIWPFRFLGG